MKEKMQKSLTKRLKIIEGQVRGLQRMIESHTYCIDIIVQSAAVKKALVSFEDTVFENHLSTHVIEQIKSGKEDRAITEIMKAHQLSAR